MSHVNAAATHKRTKQSSWVSLTTFFALASFVEIVLFSNLAAFTPVYLKYVGFDDADVKFWTGILASVGMLLGFWFVPMWGVLADRYGRKPLIVRSFAVEAVACVIMALAPNIWIFTFGRMLTGLALGNTGLMFASLSEHAPRQRVGFAIALVTGSQPLGGVFGSLLGGMLVSAFGIIVLWWFNALIITAVFVLLALLYHEAFSPKPTPHILQMLRGALRAVGTTPVVVRYFVFSFIATMGSFFTSPFLSTRLIEIAHTFDIGATIGVVFGIAGIATLIATPVWGALADKFGHARLLPIVTFMTACAYIPLYFASTVTHFTLFYFVLSAFSPAINSLTFATIGLETPPERRNAVMSMLYMPLNAAIIFAPTLASVLTSAVQQVFLFSAALVFGAFGFLIKTRRAAPQEESVAISGR
jgi:DHA1 family multidrug resistance protein-like MFS transporter